MLRVESKLNEAGLQSQMLLQVHDELVLEVPQSELMTIAKLYAPPWKVPRVGSAVIGINRCRANWLDNKELKDA